jgi:hypothetical protein
LFTCARFGRTSSSFTAEATEGNGRRVFSFHIDFYSLQRARMTAPELRGVQRRSIARSASDLLGFIGSVSIAKQ